MLIPKVESFLIRNSRRRQRLVFLQQLPASYHCNQQQHRHYRWQPKPKPKLRQVDDALQATIQKYDKKRPRPRSLNELLEASSAPIADVNEFLREEYCIRSAERICMLQERLGIFRLQAIPELTEAYNLQMCNFEAMEQDRGMEDFTAVVRSIKERGQSMVPLMCKGMSRLVQYEQHQQKEKNTGETEADNSRPSGIIAEPFINQFLNEFLLNRIGSNVLMSQYLTIQSDTPTSIVDPQCNVTAICGTAARQVRELCAQETGYRPTIRIESHSSIENDPNQVTASFAFIPGILSYILQELLKNSAVATARRKSHQDATISVVICADERRVMIHIGDKGGGIPFDVGQHIWSYLYTTKNTKQTQQKNQQKGSGGNLKDHTNTYREWKNKREKKGPTYLGGFGVGLPLSRLYASYLGGSINLVSLPGYGTHAYVFLPRLPQNLVEVVPERANHYDWDLTKSYGEFIL